MKKLIANIILWEGWIYSVGLFLIALFVGGYWALVVNDGTRCFCWHRRDSVFH